MSFGRRPRRPAPLTTRAVTPLLLLLFIASSSLSGIAIAAASLLPATSNSESQLLKLPLKGTTRPLGLARRSKHHLVSRQEPVWVPGLYDYEMTVLSIPVSIGTPPREFLLLFDTGSSDTWVPFPDCGTEDGCVSSTELYNPTNSSTYASTNYDFNITYGSGSADGVYFADTVSIANATLSKQILGGVHAMAGTLTHQTDFDPVTIDGLFGAAFPALTVMYDEYDISYRPIPFGLYEAKVIPSPVFSVHIKYTSTSEWAGSVVFGGYDRNLVDASQDMVFTDVIPKVPRGSNDNSKTFHTHWDAYVNKFVLNRGRQNEQNLTFPQQQQFLIDTGTNYIIMPEADADKLVGELIPDAVKDDLSYLLNCDGYDPQSTITIEFPRQGNSGTILVTTSIAGLIYPEGGASSMCRLVIHPSSEKVYILGNFFLQHFLTIYDFGDNPRIGFALLKE